MAETPEVWCAAYWQLRAKEMRTQAVRADHGDARAALLRISDLYDRLSTMTAARPHVPTLGSAPRRHRESRADTARG